MPMVVIITRDVEARYRGFRLCHAGIGTRRLFTSAHEYGSSCSNLERDERLVFPVATRKHCYDLGG